jgi:hypothetical protein
MSEENYGAVFNRSFDIVLRIDTSLSNYTHNDSCSRSQLMVTISRVISGEFSRFGAFMISQILASFWWEYSPRLTNLAHSIELRTIQLFSVSGRDTVRERVDRASILRDAALRH